MTIIIYPRENDILFGRGKPFQTHRGNIRMKKIIEPYLNIYQSSPRHLKTAITKHVTRTIRESVEDQGFSLDGDSASMVGNNPAVRPPPIRFLKPNPEYHEDDDDRVPRWIEANDEEIFNKISHCLRKKESSRRAPSGTLGLDQIITGHLGRSWLESVTQQVREETVKASDPAREFSPSKASSMYASSLLARTSSPNPHDLLIFDERLFDLSPSQVQSVINKAEKYSFFPPLNNKISGALEPVPILGGRALGSSVPQVTPNCTLEYFFTDPGMFPPSPSIFD